VHTWVPDECDKLMMENLNKVSLHVFAELTSRTSLIKTNIQLLNRSMSVASYVRLQFSPLTSQSMISHLWHAPKAATALGTACTGSSEAIMLGGLALKRRWQVKMKAAGKSIHEPGPNIVMGAEAQVALEKFARYFEVECRLVPVSKEVRDFQGKMLIL